MINDGGCYFWFIQISRNYEIPGWKIRRASMTVAVEHKYVCCTQFKCIFFALGNNLQTVSFVKQQTFSGLWKNLHKFLFERIFIPQQNINSCKNYFLDGIMCLSRDFWNIFELFWTIWIITFICIYLGIYVSFEKILLYSKKIIWDWNCCSFNLSP